MAGRVSIFENEPLRMMINLYTYYFLKKRTGFMLFGIVFMAVVAGTVNAQTTKPSSRPGHTSYPKTNREYEAERRRLLRKDSLLNFSSSIVLSAKEEAVNQQLIRLRKNMIAYYDSIHFFPPSKSFYKSSAHIYSTPLFRILKKMPKGGIQHLHPSAGVSYRWIIEQALREQDCYVYWQEERKPFLKGQLHFYKQGQAPEGFYPIKKLQDSIPHFSEKLYDLLTFDESIKQDSVDVWTEFEKCFDRIGGFTSYQPVYEKFLLSMFDSLIADGIQHVELRSHLSSSLYDLEHPEGTFQKDSIIRYMSRAVEKVRMKEPDFTVTLIYTNVRFQPVEEIRNDFIKAFAARKQYPDLIKGYDLVAQEDAGHTTDYYREVWLMRDSLTKVYGVDMPLFLHDGESDWQHVQNLYDAVLLRAPRIGHAFNLSFFPAVEEKVRQQNSCLEVSPLSNQILGYVGDLRIHPAHSWIKRGIQISVNPDDPGLFGYVGVTPDYWAIFLAWELDLRDLKKLCMNSIVYSSLSQKEKAKAMASWQKKWNRFIDEWNSK